MQRQDQDLQSMSDPTVFLAQVDLYNYSSVESLLNVLGVWVVCLCRGFRVEDGCLFESRWFGGDDGACRCWLLDAGGVLCYFADKVSQYHTCRRLANPVKGNHCSLV